MKKSRGLTLIELLVAMIVVGILAAIAIPSYREYVIRGHRRAAQAAMAEIATRELQYFAANREFADTATLGFALPPDVSDYYALTITPSLNGSVPSFTITMDPAGTSQAGDGILTLTSEGVKTPPEKW
jgi:type IV pilus assembly protein PilE